MVKAYFDNIRHIILEELDTATDKIIIAVYWFTNQTLFQKIMAKVADGIKVELIIHNDYINNRESGLNFQNFIDSGGIFYFSDTFNPMHNKFCVIDDKILINGSYNWTYYAEDRNRENILLIKEERETIDAFTTEFNKLKSLTERVEKIRPLTQFEVDEYNILRARDYLANDIVFQAKATGNKEIIESAFQIAPENIEVQKTAFELNLTMRYKLKHSIGSSLKDDG
ncbi:MAG: phospholipase D-like domain-containing protein, partial [Dysgonamonadaceae bacterium]|nr:phospholipase D-like domain-containing protein [Dysgonamonadaceae bacterium]